MHFCSVATRVFGAHRFRQGSLTSVGKATRNSGMASTTISEGIKKFSGIGGFLKKIY